MADQKVLETQKWLNATYELGLTEDGITGNNTVKGLIKALQKELETTADGILGEGSKKLFNNRFPNGLSESTYNPKDKNIVYIIQGGFYCRGIDPSVFNGFFGVQLTEAVKEMQSQIGLETLNGVVDAKIVEAILTTDAFTLIANGSEEIRNIQKNMNKKYGSYLNKYIPTNGVYERQTNKAFIIAIQVEVGSTVDGIWGNDTMNKCPTLMVGSTNRNMIYILQYLLFCNGINPNGIDGGYGNGLKDAVMQFQEFCALDADGICGKQTWASLVVSCGDRNRQANACDTRFEITNDNAEILKNNGYYIVGRYLTGGDFKELKNGEVERILEHGMRMFPIFQDNARSANDFNYEQGMQDAKVAVEAAREKGMPNNTIIYFAVDYDAVDDEVTEYIIPYFNAVKEYLSNTEYKVGVYGPRNVCIRVGADSSFVSDMSTGFSGNIGYKLPNNWNYDQINNITITDSIHGSLEIDKDIHKGNDYGVSRVTPNGRIYNQLVKLYNCAVSQGSSDIASANKNVLDFLRGKYVGESWDKVAGKPESKYINKVKEIYPEINPENMNTLCEDVRLNIQHFALSAKVCTTIIPGAVAEVRDYTSWAGDLVQLAAEMQKVYDNNGHIFTEDEIYNLIGCDDDKVAQNLGFENAEKTGFSVEDLYQDMDAFVFGSKLKTETIYNIYRDYYLKEKCNNKNRANQFYDYLNKDGYTGTKLSILRQIASFYTHKPPILSEIFENMFGTFDEELWGDKLANAFARKVINMMEES